MLQSFRVGATRKTIEADQFARFPLWSKSADAAVVSIYRGHPWQSYIENDELPAGCLGEFVGTPNLKKYNKNGKPLRERFSGA